MGENLPHSTEQYPTSPTAHVFGAGLGPLRHTLEALHDKWWCFLLLGVALVVFGTIALSSAFFVSVAAVVLFGLLMLGAGMAQVIAAFWAGKWDGFLIHLIVGVLYLVIGMLVVKEPLESTLEFTLLIAAMFFVSGILRIISAMTLQYTGWGLVLLNGVISVLLGVMIYRQWPASGAWVIGLFVGIDMIFNGFSWIMLSLGLKNLPKLPVAPKV